MLDGWMSTVRPFHGEVRCAVRCCCAGGVKIKLNLTHIWYFPRGHHVTITRPYHPQHHQTSADSSMNHHSRTWIKECSSSFISLSFSGLLSWWEYRHSLAWQMCFHVLSCSGCSSWAAKCFVIQSCPVFIFRKLQVFRKNLHENNFLR